MKALERCIQDIVIPICIRCTSAQHPISHLAHPVFVVLVPVVRPNLTHTHTHTHPPSWGPGRKRGPLKTIGYSRIFSTQRQQQPHTQTTYVIIRYNISFFTRTRKRGKIRGPQTSLSLKDRRANDFAYRGVPGRETL